MQTDANRGHFLTAKRHLINHSPQFLAASIHYHCKEQQTFMACQSHVSLKTAKSQQELPCHGTVNLFVSKFHQLLTRCGLFFSLSSKLKENKALGFDTDGFW